MNLRQLLREDFDIDLPIRGGNGNSIDNPIIIERTEINHYVGTEYTILELLGIGRGIEWKMVSQHLMQHNDRSIDKLKIETVETTETEIITQIENYYFDITECM